jgi:hypothetical protein
MVEFIKSMDISDIAIFFGVAVLAGITVSLLDSYVVQRAEAAVGLVPSNA